MAKATSPKRSAKKSGAAEKKKRPEQTASPEPVKAVIPVTTLKSLMAEYRKMKKTSGALASGYASSVATAVERYNINKKALSLVNWLDARENEQIKDFLDQLDYLLDASGIDERAKTIVGLPLERGENVTDFPAQQAVAGE
jgi:hypothetical protein